MAKEAMVTRTIMTTEVNVMCLNVETAEPFNKDVSLAGTFKDDKTIKKAVVAKVDNDTEKAVHVVHVEVKETLYGMTEEKFILNATVLPTRAAKLV